MNLGPSPRYFRVSLEPTTLKKVVMCDLLLLWPTLFYLYPVDHRPTPLGKLYSHLIIFWKGEKKLYRFLNILDLVVHPVSA